MRIKVKKLEEKLILNKVNDLSLKSSFTATVNDGNERRRVVVDDLGNPTSDQRRRWYETGRRRRWTVVLNRSNDRGGGMK